MCLITGCADYRTALFFLLSFFLRTPHRLPRLYLK